MLAIEPGEASALAEVDELRAATEPIEAWLRAGQRPHEPSPAEKVKGFGTAQHERDDVLGLAIAVGADPKRAGTVIGITFHVEPKLAALAVLEFSREFVANGDSGLRVFGRADVEDA